MSSVTKDSQLNQQQSIAVLKVYTVYHTLLCLVLLSTLLLAAEIPLLGKINPSQLFYTTCIYLMLNLTGLIIVLAKEMKLASSNRLTASIAHKIRKPSGVISYAAPLLGESKSLNNTDQSISKIIQKHSRRMNNVIKNVLAVSSRNTPNPERIILKLWLQL